MHKAGTFLKLGQVASDPLGVSGQRMLRAAVAAQYRRLVKRMGKKKGLVAVGHSILRIVYHVLARKQGYHEPGGDVGARRSVKVQRQQ